MAARIGIGVLSFAHGHVAAYVDVMKDFDDVALVAAYDDNEARGEDVCSRAGMRYTPHVEDVLDNPDVQVVMIGSETSRHAELAVAAAAAGKDMLVQKPMAMSLAECDAMIAAADKAGVRLGVAFQMRHDPANIKIRELVQGGAVGNVAVCRRRHCIGVLFMPWFLEGPTHWHVEADKNIGMFFDDAAHPADWFHWIFGKPVSVIAEVDKVVTDVAPDDNGVAVYRFDGGVMGILFNSATVLAGENTTEVYGDQGCLIQNYGDGPACSVPACPEGPALKLFRHGEAAWTPIDTPVPPDQGCRIRAVPRPWVDCWRNGAPLPATGADGRVAVEMVLGAYQAAREGRRVTFPLQRDGI